MGRLLRKKSSVAERGSAAGGGGGTRRSQRYQCCQIPFLVHVACKQQWQRHLRNARAVPVGSTSPHGHRGLPVAQSPDCPAQALPPSMLRCSAKKNYGHPALLMLRGLTKEWRPLEVGIKDGVGLNGEVADVDDTIHGWHLGDVDCNFWAAAYWRGNWGLRQRRIELGVAWVRFFPAPA